MRLLFVHRTRLGSFYIAEYGGRFHPVFNQEKLGSYSRPEQAAEDLADGCTFSVTGVEDTSVLGIPNELSEWIRLTDY